MNDIEILNDNSTLIFWRINIRFNLRSTIDSDSRMVLGDQIIFHEYEICVSNRRENERENGFNEWNCLLENVILLKKQYPFINLSQTKYSSRCSRLQVWFRIRTMTLLLTDMVTRILGSSPVETFMKRTDRSQRIAKSKNTDKRI